jgi:hypothetical protein
MDMIKYCNTKNTAQYKLDGTVLDLASLSYLSDKLILGR